MIPIHLSNANPLDSIKKAYAILDRVQTQSVGDQVLQMVLPFSMICKHYQVNPVDVLEYSDRLIREALALNSPELKAFEAYLKGEL